LETLLEAAPRLPAECSIDIYGPLDEYTAEAIRERGRGRIHYRGFLSHEQVDATLWNYDCLVLPTFHPGEGYPGVIAEAFAHGLPVITTRWLAIPEMVDDTCGLLIEPQDTPAFVAALTALHRDSTLWLKLREGARLRAAQFDHAQWSRKFEAICERLVRT
jgi:glycosyltransferase involved in cell wall biosynthesis